MFLRSTTKPPIVSLWGSIEPNIVVFYEGGIVPPSKLMVTKIIVPPEGGVIIRGVDRSKSRCL